MITTHVLDTALGQPGAGIKVQLSLLDTDNWVDVTQGTTNQDGRIPGWLDGKTLLAGTYRIRFELQDYLLSQQQPVFYPYAEIVFVVADPAAHFHIPLLLSPFGYSTYRGS
ncbi:hydroxyisourate hydrolase [Parathalassolituus penaei]|uniref:5-hydroxyisourate hydrolase n=1 Tax=Parathalassolituus penaei TaxID=2997323 RepID=A0A9X3EBV1_9GAMM|nr:hydroxyisourate hydrolase [Parathalassolituus penaei]MCY0963979.1 hydroxyisourate hydrolase [Parathalassolituus penaei]